MLHRIYITFDAKYKLFEITHFYAFLKAYRQSKKDVEEFKGFDFVDEDSVLVTFKCSYYQIPAFFQRDFLREYSEYLQNAYQENGYTKYLEKFIL